jgi:hypothetical protein
MATTSRWIYRLAAFGLSAFAVSACGFTGNMRHDPGFASFQSPSLIPGAHREFALSLGPVPIRVATMISRPLLNDEPWIPDVLRTIRAVRVYTYRIGDDDTEARHHLEDTRAELLEDGWEPVVVVREDGGFASAFVMQPDPTTVRGLVVMVLEDEELVLVNVMGKMTPKALGAIIEELDLDLPRMDVDIV